MGWSDDINEYNIITCPNNQQQIMVHCDQNRRQAPPLVFEIVPVAQRSLIKLERRWIYHLLFLLPDQMRTLIASHRSEGSEVHRRTIDHRHL